MRNSQNTVLVIAAHPDDETLGMGGTIHRMIQEGDELHVLFLSNGVGSRDLERELSSSRLSAARRALDLLGCNSVSFGDFPDNSFDSVGILTIAKFIEKKVSEIHPNVVFTNFYSDLNVDHRISAEASLIAARPKPNNSINELYFYEVLSSTGWQFGAKEFTPNYFVNISNSITYKEAALLEYDIEMDEAPSARSYASVKALAKHRGSFVGLDFAEAFEVAFVRSK